jgi:Tripartite ATP-independent periplasmic transporters, DctQ component
VNPDLPHHDRLHVGVGRFCLGMVSLGVTICFGYGACLCWFGRDFARALGGRGDTSEILGVTLPYPIMMTLLVVMCVLCAFVAVYALFFPTQSESD